MEFSQNRLDFLSSCSHLACVSSNRTLLNIMPAQVWGGKTHVSANVQSQTILCTHYFRHESPALGMTGGDTVGSQNQADTRLCARAADVRRPVWVGRGDGCYAMAMVKMDGNDRIQCSIDPW